MSASQEETMTVWEVRYSGLPAVWRHCKRCGTKREHRCTGEFRVNAQQKALDIWLIYHCTHCNAVWNSTILSHTSLQKLGTGLLERFQSNDEALARRYAMDAALLQKNGAGILLPPYEVLGETVSQEKAARIVIRSAYPLPLKLSAVLRGKLGLSRQAFGALLAAGRVRCSGGQDPAKAKLSCPETVVTIVPAAPDSPP